MKSSPPPRTPGRQLAAAVSDRHKYRTLFPLYIEMGASAGAPLCIACVRFILPPSVGAFAAVPGPQPGKTECQSFAPTDEFFKTNHF